MTIPRLLALAAALLLTACVFPGERPEPTIYRLQLPPAAALPSFQTRDAVLALDAPDAPADLRGRAIAYQPAPHQLRYYTLSQWADPPPRMLESALMAAFERAGLFRGVVRSGAAGRADYRLGTELLRLEQDFTAEGPSRLKLVLRVQLTDIAERRLLGSTVVEVVQPAPSDDAVGAVEAAHQALAKAMAETLQFVAESLP